MGWPLGVLLIEHFEMGTSVNVLFRLSKLIKILATRDMRLSRALRSGVAAGVEHLQVLEMTPCQTFVDVGANRGQFALAARYCYPDAEIVSFEPLEQPAKVFRRLFTHDRHVAIHQVAVGPETRQVPMHLSARDDSSSVLPILPSQTETFPGTEEIGVVSVEMAPLAVFLTPEDILRPAMLKIDVQGFEWDVLRGCEPLLGMFDWIYCECSFLELYAGQKLAPQIIDWLAGKGFALLGMFNPTIVKTHRLVQADCLFRAGESA